MSSCSEIIEIKQDIKATYHIAERYPEFIKFYSKKKIIREDEESSEVSIQSIFFGFKFSWEGKSKKNKYNNILWTQTKGLLKGMRADWIFYDLKNDKTQVVLQVKYNSIFLPWDWLAKFIFIRKTLPKILNDLKTACESSPC